MKMIHDKIRRVKDSSYQQLPHILLTEKQDIFVVFELGGY